MRILVAGAAGFLGSHIAEAAVLAGHEVRALIHPADDPAFLRGLGVDPLAGDLVDPDVASRAVDGRELVLNATGRAGDYGTFDDFHRANVTATESLLAAAARGGVRRLVHASSYMVSIGGSFQHWAGGVIDERTPPFRYWGWDFYGRAKVAAEQAVLRAHEPGRFEVVPLRIGWVYGPRDQTSFPGLVEILRGGRGVVIGAGQNRLGLLYAADVAEAFLLAATKGESGRPYVVAGVADERPITQAEYLSAIAGLIGCPMPRIHLPFAVADRVGRVMETTWHVLGQKHRPMLTSFAVHLLGRDQVFDTTRARADLGWSPRVAFADGMQRTMAWLNDAESKPSAKRGVA